MENTRTIKSMVLEFMCGLMAEHTLVIGLMESRLMKEFIFCPTATLERVIGKMAKDKTGLILVMKNQPAIGPTLTMQ